MTADFILSLAFFPSAKSHSNIQCRSQQAKYGWAEPSKLAVDQNEDMAKIQRVAGAKKIVILNGMWR